MYEVPYSTPIKFVWEEYQNVKRGREYHGCGEVYKHRKGKQYHLPYDIKAVGKNTKWGRGKGGLNLTRNSRLKKKSGGEEYQVEENFIRP